MQKDSKALFANTPVLKLFFIAAIPGMISMAAASVYSLMEGIFIGQFLGGVSFAAQNLAMPFIMIGFALSDLIGVGSSVQISIALGKKDEARANGLFTASLLMILVCATFMGLFMFFAAPPIIAAMGAEGETLRLATNYLRVYAILAPLCSFTFAMDNYLRICGFIRGSMALNIFMSGLNIG
ncbi:MAG: MATE family efflux transporter, partial [Ruminococcaceae bacterium]|nr:MATE family efflux transporter [Oscillospiraceae bacterium]